MIHGSTTSAIVALENIEHDAKLKIGTSLIGEPEHASGVGGSSEADDLGAGHVERAQRGIERIDRVPAGGQHEIGPFLLQTPISAAMTSASRGKSLNPITDPPYQPIFCATDAWNLSRTRQSGPSVLITPTRGLKRRDLNDGTLGGDSLGLEQRRFGDRHRSHFDSGDDLARYDRNPVFECKYRHTGQAVEPQQCVSIDAEETFCVCYQVVATEGWTADGESRSRHCRRQASAGSSSCTSSTRG